MMTIEKIGVNVESPNNKWAGKMTIPPATTKRKKEVRIGIGQSQRRGGPK